MASLVYEREISVVQRRRRLRTLQNNSTNEQKQKLCTPCTCVFPFPSFFCRPRPDNKEFKKRRRLRLRQRQKPVILLVKRTKMIMLHVRHAFLNKSLPYSSKLQREMTKFQVLTTTWTNYSQSFSLTLYFKSVRTNPVIGHFAHIA